MRKKGGAEVGGLSAGFLGWLEALDFGLRKSLLLRPSSLSPCTFLIPLHDLGEAMGTWSIKTF